MLPPPSKGGDTPKTGWRLLLRPHEEAGKGEGYWTERRQQLFTSFVVWPSHLALSRLYSSTKEGEGLSNMPLNTYSGVLHHVCFTGGSLRPEQVPELALCCPQRKFPEQNAEARSSPANIHGAPVLPRATMPP